MVNVAEVTMQLSTWTYSHIEHQNKGIPTNHGVRMAASQYYLNGTTFITLHVEYWILHDCITTIQPKVVFVSSKVKLLPRDITIHMEMDSALRNLIIWTHPLSSSNDLSICVGHVSQISTLWHQPILYFPMEACHLLSQHTTHSPITTTFYHPHAYWWNSRSNGL